MRRGDSQYATSGDVASLQGQDPAARDQSSRERPDREGLRREQDRRLERSLYEGHTMEAGWDEPGQGFEANFEASFEAMQEGETGGTTEAEGADSAGGELELFPYSSAGTLPDAEEVRGAILRLARGSETWREPSGTWGAPRHGAAAEPLPPVNFGPPHVEPPAPGLPNFGDVACRVWAAHSAAADLVRQGVEEPKDTSLRKSPDVHSPLHSALDTALDTASDTASDTAMNPTETERSREESGSRFAPPSGSLQTSRRSEALPSDADAVPDSEQAPAELMGVAGDGPALAHDACNLLSGLALYSELLASPGVLGEQHRHYAAELKLLAERSQALIDRLLRLTAPSAAEAGVEEAQATSLTHLLMRWGSLLSTLAQGRLEVVFGAHAATPVPASAEALERILVNLVRNARAATIAGGAIRIGVGGTSQERAEMPSPAASPASRPEESRTHDGAAGVLSPRTIALTVDDSGCGMTEEQIRRVLGLGLEDAADGHGLTPDSAGEMVSSGRGQSPEDSRGHLGRDLGSASQTAPGAPAQGPDRRRGLGLQIVRELVAASGGSLSIQSRPGTGTRVEIRWPVAVFSAAEIPVSEIPVSEICVSEQAAMEPEAAKLQLTKVPETERPALSAGKSAPRRAAEAAMDTGAATVRKPVLQSVAEPIVAEPTLEDRKEGAGPDGFSEVELRAMMLRLHRAGPYERSPLGRGLRDWGPLEERRRGGVQDWIGRADRGFGVPECDVAGTAVAGCGVVGAGILRPDVRRAVPGGSAHQDRAAKGAMAC